MTRIEIINGIQHYNRSASREFLLQFSNDDLAAYLRQVRDAAIDFELDELIDEPTAELTAA